MNKILKDHSRVNRGPAISCESTSAFLGLESFVNGTRADTDLGPLCASNRHGTVTVSKSQFIKEATK